MDGLSDIYVKPLSNLQGSVATPPDASSGVESASGEQDQTMVIGAWLLSAEPALPTQTMALPWNGVFCLSLRLADPLTSSVRAKLWFPWTSGDRRAISSGRLVVSSADVP